MASHDRRVAYRPRSTSPTDFIKKTYQLVDGHYIDHIISWTSDGSTFVIWRPGDFAVDLLPQKFKHNNLDSFIRQLYRYGFKKISPDLLEFAHEFFRRGQKGLLSRINYRRRPLAAASASSGNNPILLSDLNGGTTELMEENGQLKRENARHLVSNYSLDGGGVGGRFEAKPAQTTARGEGSRTIDDKMEEALGSEESVSYPGEEEELSLRLSLAHLPNKRACNGLFRSPT